MVLKETFRMQNYLTELTQQAMLFLSEPEHVMMTKKVHLYSQGRPDKEDAVTVARESEMDAGKVIDLLMDLLAEKEKLALAINRAKTSAPRDMDASLAANKTRQEVIRRFMVLARLKASESESFGKDYYMTPAGTQDTYMYPVKTIQTIDFDRNKVKGIIKRLQKESDAVSSEIDLMNLTIEVDYEPKYEPGEPLEDVYEKFCADADSSGLQ